MRDHHSKQKLSNYLKEQGVYYLVQHSQKRYFSIMDYIVYKSLRVA